MSETKRHFGKEAVHKKRVSTISGAALGSDSVIRIFFYLEGENEERSFEFAVFKPYMKRVGGLDLKHVIDEVDYRNIRREAEALCSRELGFRPLKNIPKKLDKTPETKYRGGRARKKKRGEISEADREQFAEAYGNVRAENGAEGPEVHIDVYPNGSEPFTVVFIKSSKGKPVRPKSNKTGSVPPALFDILAREAKKKFAEIPGK